MRYAALFFTVAILAFAAEAASAGTYAGWIPNAGGGAANDDPMVVTTNAAGTSVRSVVMAFRPTCTDDRMFAFHRRLPVRMTDGPGGELVPLRNSGGRFEGRLQAESVGTPYTFVESGTVKGTFTRTSAKGTISVSVSVFDEATGAAVMTCQTNTLRFTLKRHRGVVYGGMTAQDEPVTMVLSNNRRRVVEFGFDMHATCSPEGFVDLPDWITNFKIRNGRFGDTFSYRDDDGDRRAFRFSGRATRTRASGTVSMTLTTQDGTVCRTGRMRWSLRSG